MRIWIEGLVRLHDTIGRIAGHNRDARPQLLLGQSPPVDLGVAPRLQSQLVLVGSDQ
jgi:hypothetical protein